MGYTQQFRKMLNDLEDGEIKTSLVNAFGNVELDLDSAIEKRGIATRELAEYKTSISGLIGSDDLEQVQSKVKTLSETNNGDIDKIKLDLQSKYESDTNELRKLLDSEKSKLSDLTATYEGMLFNSEVEKQGLLKGFKTDNPRVKEMLLSEIKSKLLLEDGVFYVKDGSDDKARDIKTGNYLNAKSISDGMLASNDWADFVTPEIKAQGGGTPPNQTVVTGKKFSDYNSSELVALNKTNPAKYQQLKQQSLGV